MAPVVAIAKKENPLQTVGISFKTCKAGLIISKISPDGLFANKTLRVGMIVQSINGVGCQGTREGLSIAISLLKSAQEQITIVAETPVPTKPVVVMVTKPNKEAKLGIGLTSDIRGLTITSLFSDCLFTNTALRVGMVVWSINGVECMHMEASEATELLKSAEGQVTIVAEESAASVPQAKSGIPAITTTATTSGGSNPPPGCQEGGQWGVNQYAGPLTCVACLLLGICVFCCPFDERDAYVVDGNLYDASGRYLGRSPPMKFIPSRR